MLIAIRIYKMVHFETIILLFRHAHSSTDFNAAKTTIQVCNLLALTCPVTVEILTITSIFQKIIFSVISSIYNYYSKICASLS